MAVDCSSLMFCIIIIIIITIIIIRNTKLSINL